MDQKPLIGNVCTAVATAAILGLLGWVFGVFSAGQDALTEQQIKDVIAEVMILDDGRTYAAALDSIDKSVGEINVSVGHIQGDISRIDTAVGILAAE